MLEKTQCSPSEILEGNKHKKINEWRRGSLVTSGLEYGSRGLGSNLAGITLFFFNGNSGYLPVLGKEKIGYENGLRCASWRAVYRTPQFILVSNLFSPKHVNGDWVRVRFHETLRTTLAKSKVFQSTLHVLTILKAILLLFFLYFPPSVFARLKNEGHQGKQNSMILIFFPRIYNCWDLNAPVFFKLTQLEFRHSSRILWNRFDQVGV